MSRPVLCVDMVRVLKRICDRSGYHISPSVPIQSPWVTVRFRDDYGRIICYGVKGGNVFNRLHVFKDPKMNVSDAVRPTKLFVVDEAMAKAAQKKVRRFTPCGRYRLTKCASAIERLT